MYTVLSDEARLRVEHGAQATLEVVERSLGSSFFFSCNPIPIPLYEVGGVSPLNAYNEKVR